MIASAPVSAAVAALRLGAIEQTLLALRTLRVEVELVRPGLVLERIDGWHADAAELHAERASELRLALAGAEQALLDAEAGLEVERERARVAHAAALATATPDRPVTGSGGRW